MLVLLCLLPICGPTIVAVGTLTSPVTDLLSQFVTVVVFDVEKISLPFLLVLHTTLGNS